jgi:hypothetical protein
VDKKNNGAIFVINDTISINYFDSTRYYKGVFSMKNKEIVLYENMLIGNNADVVTEECDKDYIEFSLYEKYRNYAMGHLRPMIASIVENLIVFVFGTMIVCIFHQKTIRFYVFIAVL